ncbi:MAG: FAD-dependent oxidoreductase [Planctomycetota bacterium]
MNSSHCDYDVCIIGGGIHGVGVAQAAAAAGYRVVLIEKSTIAAGTSRASSKLIHGGLRYLETLQFSLVRESLIERRRLLRNAPHLVRRVPFHIPIYRTTRRRPWQIRAGLSIYALLGGLRENGFRSLPRSQWADLDGLRTDGLQKVFQYWDGQTDDALLTAAVMRSSQALGADLLAPAELLDGHVDGDRVTIRYTAGENTQQLTTGVVVNAAGPWINEVAARLTNSHQPVDVDLVQGAHIVVNAPLQAGVYYTEAPRDGRAVFLMPWYGQTLVGTTETAFAADPNNVSATADEIDYLVESLQHALPEHPTDVIQSFAGLRVLPRGDGKFAKRSRETHLVTDSAARPRVLTIAGGKLTGYRATAERVVAQLRPSLPPATAIADPRDLRLPVVERDPSVTPGSAKL